MLAEQRPLLCCCCSARTTREVEKSSGTGQLVDLVLYRVIDRTDISADSHGEYISYYYSLVVCIK